MEIGKPTLPEHGAIASQAGDGDCERLLQTSKAGEGRAPVRSAELEPGDGGTAAVPADDLPGEGVGLGRPGDSQLITSRPNNAEGIPIRACGTAPGRAGSAWMPVTAGCWLTAHADASDPSDDPSPREPVRRLKQRSAVFDTEETQAAPSDAVVVGSPGRSRPDPGHPEQGGAETSTPTAVDRAAPVIAHHEVDIQAALDTVWELHTDINAWPTWQSDITAARLDGALEPGASFDWTSYGLSVTSTIYDVAERSRLLWGGTADGITGVHEWVFSETPGGVHVTTDESFAGEPVASREEASPYAPGTRTKAPTPRRLPAHSKRRRTAIEPRPKCSWLLLPTPAGTADRCAEARLARHTGPSSARKPVPKSPTVSVEPLIAPVEASATARHS
jgi:Polyketide cyclase / dehydrase and lipid transport